MANRQRNSNIPGGLLKNCRNLGLRPRHPHWTTTSSSSDPSAASLPSSWLPSTPVPIGQFRIIPSFVHIGGAWRQGHSIASHVVTVVRILSRRFQLHPISLGLRRPVLLDRGIHVWESLIHCTHVPHNWKSRTSPERWSNSGKLVDVLKSPINQFLLDSNAKRQKGEIILN